MPTRDSESGRLGRYLDVTALTVDSADSDFGVPHGPPNLSCALPDYSDGLYRAAGSDSDADRDFKLPVEVDLPVRLGYAAPSSAEAGRKAPGSVTALPPAESC